jgi:hypothetical protein
MKLNTVVTEEDYVKAYYLHLRPRSGYKIAGYLFLVLAVFILLLSGYRVLAYRENPLVPTMLLIALISLGYYFKVTIPEHCKKIFQQLKERHEDSHLEITDEGIFGKTAFGEDKYPWHHLRKWKENKTMFLIYPADVLFIILSKRCFSSSNEVVECRELLTKKIGSVQP